MTPWGWMFMLSPLRRSVYRGFFLLAALFAIWGAGVAALALRSGGSFNKWFFFGSILFFIAVFVVESILADRLADGLSKPLKGIAEAIRSRPGFNQKLRFPKPDSLELDILMSEISHLWDQLGSFQKTNVQELSAEHKRLETVLSSMEDAVLVLDNAGRVLQVNEGMLQILGLPIRLVTGQPWSDLSTSHENYLKLREALRGGELEESSIELIVSGKKRVYSARNREILTRSKQRIGSLFLLHDITESQELLSVLSNELQTPLQSLEGAVDVLSKKGTVQNEETRTLAETIGEDVARIRSVATDFVEASAVDFRALRLKLEKKPIDKLLQEWIKDAAALEDAADEVRLQFPEGFVPT